MIVWEEITHLPVHGTIPLITHFPSLLWDLIKWTEFENIVVFFEKK